MILDSKKRLFPRLRERIRDIDRLRPDDRMRIMYEARRHFDAAIEYINWYVTEDAEQFRRMRTRLFTSPLEATMPKGPPQVRRAKDDRDVTQIMATINWLRARQNAINNAFDKLIDQISDEGLERRRRF